MRLTSFLIAGSIVAVCGASASASFQGWSSETIALSNGHVIVNIYAQLSASGDRVWNAFATHTTTNHIGGFFESAANPFWKPGNSENKSTSDDSWLCVGSNPTGNGNAGGAVGGFAADVLGDPNFVNFDNENGATDYSYIQNYGPQEAAAWFNGNPLNAYGYANVVGDIGRVLLAHFVLAGPFAPGDAVHWDNYITIKLAGSTSTLNVTALPMDILIPGPGAAALFGLVCVGRGRRR